MARAANFRRLGVPLAPHTTLRLGGPAAEFVRPETESDVAEIVSEASKKGRPFFVLGGGSNVVVADEGYLGLVISMERLGGVTITKSDDFATVVVGAGEPWDTFVRRMVAEGFAGIECLAAIPGFVGATPIQNVGAYGSEVVETIESVRAFDRDTSTFVDIANGDCDFRYRHSRFKGDARFVVVAVRFRFDVATASRPIRYAELANALGVSVGERAPASLVADTVTTLRRAKGMVRDDTDPESVSAGSFFTNPVVSRAEYAAFVECARSGNGVAVGLDASTPIPHFPADGDRVKLAAG